jgi:anhydro-N-acetylmuramic acid kinase
VHEALVARWLAHPYYQLQPPKTTGRELYTAALAETMRAEAQAAGASDVDFVATVTALTAATIADAYARFAPGPVAEVVIAGGGAHNPVLLAELRTRLSASLGREIEVVTHDGAGHRRRRQRSADLRPARLSLRSWSARQRAGVYGSKQETILGTIAPGRNYRRLEIRLECEIRRLRD